MQFVKTKLSLFCILSKAILLPLHPYKTPVGYSRSKKDEFLKAKQSNQIRICYCFSQINQGHLNKLQEKNSIYFPFSFQAAEKSPPSSPQPFPGEHLCVDLQRLLSPWMPPPTCGTVIRAISGSSFFLTLLVEERKFQTVPRAWETLQCAVSGRVRLESLAGVFRCCQSVSRPQTQQQPSLRTRPGFAGKFRRRSRSNAKVLFCAKKTNFVRYLVRNFIL